MPVIGLSSVLENTVMSVLKTHSLKSWNLFSEENGGMTIRLKFDILEGSHMQEDSGRSRQDSFNTITFKRKNAKQISRDKARARKRKRRSTSSIETVRGHDFTVLPSEQNIDFNDVSIQCTPKSFEIPEIVRENSDGSELALCTVETQIETPALNLDYKDYSLDNGGVNVLDNKDDNVSENNKESSGACGEDSIQDYYLKDAFKELRQELANQRTERNFSLKDIFEELRQEFRNQPQDFTLDFTEQDSKT